MKKQIWQVVSGAPIIPPLGTSVYKIPGDELSGDRFGWSVAMNQDGTKVIVGAYLGDALSLSNPGTAQIFKWDGTAWVEEGKVWGSDTSYNWQFGRDVDMNSAGDKIIVGAYGHNNGDLINGRNKGAAYIFSFNGTSWSQDAMIQSTDVAKDDYFGQRVSMNGAGDRIISTSRGADPGGNSAAGASYIFDLDGTWSQTQKLIASDSAQVDQVGWSVDMSTDGDTVIIGAPLLDTGLGSEVGAAYIWKHNGTIFVEDEILTASDTARYTNFGTSVSVNADGTRAVIGREMDDQEGVDGENSNTGAAYLFSLSGGTWSQDQKLTHSGSNQNSYYGHAASMSDDGDTVAIGAFGLDSSAGGGNDEGSVFIYTASGTTWTLSQRVETSDADPSDRFGRDVMLSGDGTRGIGGAELDLSGTGAAYIF